MSALRDANIELIYFDAGALGRGEVVRVVLNARGIPFKDTRVPLAEWAPLKAALVAKGLSPSAHIPVLLINGQPYTEHISTARYLDRQLGLYGKDAERDYFADAVADSYQEWRNVWVDAVFGNDAAAKSKLETDLPSLLKRFETFLGKYPEGPFVTGKDFTFADAALYQILHNNTKTAEKKLVTDEYPLLSKFYEAVEQLPSISGYLKSRPDAVSDSYQEWRNLWAEAAVHNDAAAKTKLEEDLLSLLKRFETFLGKCRYPEGPFVTGSDFTFADAALYQMLHNNSETGGKELVTNEYPLLSKFYTAVEQLPSISRYLKSRNGA